MGNWQDIGHLLYLKYFLELIDREILDIYEKIKVSADPDSDGLCDKGEYIIGYGFIAIQRYMISTSPKTSLTKKEAFQLGGKIKNNISIAQAIDAGANYAKHQPEWPFIVNYEEPQEGSFLSPIKVNYTESIFEQEEFGRKTFKTIQNITPYAPYTLSNLLFEIQTRTSRNKNLCFRSLIPTIENWQDELYKKDKS